MRQKNDYIRVDKIAELWNYRISMNVILKKRRDEKVCNRIVRMRSL